MTNYKSGVVNRSHVHALIVVYVNIKDKNILQYFD